jgi:two-component system, chemotaxis family, chemotaxis protein CheY
MKILLAEDTFVGRMLLMKFLSAYGECHIAANGQEAVEACQMALDANEPYDLICLDIMMPVMDGREAQKRIRELEEAGNIPFGDGAKIVMITAVDDKDSVIQAFRDTCDGYLIKPIKKDPLEELLAKLGFSSPG